MGMRSCVVLILWFKKCVFQFDVTLVVQLFLHVLACFTYVAICDRPGFLSVYILGQDYNVLTKQLVVHTLIQYVYMDTNRLACVF